MTPSRTALCLCGGGLTGAFYEIGALFAAKSAESPLDPENADVYVGTSAGAFLAALLAAGYPLAQLRATVVGEPGAYPIRRHDFYHLEPGRAAGLFLRALGAGTTYLRRLARQRKDEPGMFERMANRGETLPAGLFSLGHYREFVERVFRDNRLPTRFRDLRRPLFVSACDLDRGERVVFGPNGPEAPSVPLAVVASGAIPMFFEPLEIDGNRLIDGETTGVAHVDLALGEGVDRVLVVNPKVPVRSDGADSRAAASNGEPARIHERGFFAVLDQASRLTTRVRLRREIEEAARAHPGVEIYLHQPDEEEATRFLYNPMTFSTRKEVFEFGYRSTLAVLKEGKLRRWNVRAERTPGAPLRSPPSIQEKADQVLA
jgi:predicted acylesterase/phospholipase RssA